MGIIIWIILGAVVGWVASAIMDTKEGVLVDIAIGIAGAVIGGWIMGFFGQSGVTGFNLYSFVVALIGAVALLALIKAFKRA